MLCDHRASGHGDVSRSSASSPQSIVGLRSRAAAASGGPPSPKADLEHVRMLSEKPRFATCGNLTSTRKESSPGQGVVQCYCRHSSHPLRHFCAAIIRGLAVAPSEKMRGLRVKLVIAALAILAGIFVYFAPKLYAGAALNFPSPGRLGPYLSVRSAPDAVFACLLAALVAFAMWRSRRNGPESLAEELPVWICPTCHEENPGNFEECWKCQRLRTHEDEDK
jgi:hypothetical protein